MTSKCFEHQKGLKSHFSEKKISSFLFFFGNFSPKFYLKNIPLLKLEKKNPEKNFKDCKNDLISNLMIGD